MTEAVDEHFRTSVTSWVGATRPDARHVDPARLKELFSAQLLSRHLDFAARWLQSQGEGFYTIGSAGHESNAAVALALRPTDPALLHYRSCAFQVARSRQVVGTDPVADVLHGVAAASVDQISGGRHKVIGSKALSIIPQTSTIGSHIPRAFGLAFALGRDPSRSEWPDDAIVVASIGDASVNHSTTLGGLNAAAYLAHQHVHLPLLVVCEDNGLGISTRSPAGWTERVLSSLPSVRYASADGADPDGVLRLADDLVHDVRSSRRPAILHLRTVRFLGHAGSDAEIAYRSAHEMAADLGRDPLLASARRLMQLGEMESAEVLDAYEDARAEVMEAAKRVVGSRRLTTAADVMRPIAAPSGSVSPAPATACMGLRR